MLETKKHELRMLIQEALESYALADTDYQSTKQWRYAKKMLSIREELISQILDFKAFED